VDANYRLRISKTENAALERYLFGEYTDTRWHVVDEVGVRYEVMDLICESAEQ